MFNKILILLLLLIIGGLGFWFGGGSKYLSFEGLSSQQMYEKITKERDVAIQKAVEAGDYRCCIHPPCTMCYMEANQWNNYKAGTCACDDLIAQGKEPCPQCKKGLCEEDDNGTCKVNPKK